MYALSPTDLGSGLFLTTIEVIVVIIAVLVAVSQLPRIPIVMWMVRRIFAPGINAVVLEPLKHWHQHAIQEQIAPLADRLEKEFGGNSGGLREMVNGIDRKTDRHYIELSQRIDATSTNATGQRAKLWTAITEIKDKMNEIHATSTNATGQRAKLWTAITEIKDKMNEIQSTKKEST